MLREKTDFFIQWERRRRKKIVDSSHANKFNFNLYNKWKEEKKLCNCNERLCDVLLSSSRHKFVPRICKNERKKNLFDRRL